MDQSNSQHADVQVSRLSNPQQVNLSLSRTVWDTLQGKGRSREEKLTLLPWLQFFLPTPTFALQCFRLISTIQLLHSSGAPVLGAQLLEHYFK